MTNVLLLYPNPLKRNFNRDVGRQPLGLYMIRSYVEKYLPDVNVYVEDAISNDTPLEKILSLISEKKIDIVGISVMTYLVPDALFIAEKVKEKFPNIILVCGGLHAACLQNDLIENEAVDFVMYGEGEISFYKLLLHQRGQLSIDAVPNLVYKDESNISHKTKREFIDKLDEIPFIDRNRIQNNLYYKKYKEVTTSLLATRGCMNTCSFCSHRLIFGTGTIRMRSVSNILEEIDLCVYNHNIFSFQFLDSNLFYDVDFVMLFCKEIIKRPYPIKWRCQAEISSLNILNNNKKKKKQFVELLEKAGCVSIVFGVESSSQSVLDKNLKNFDVSTTRSILSIFKNSNINLILTYALGLIGDTKNSIKKTMRFANLLPYTNVFLRAYPYPTTSFYKYYKNKILTGEKYWLNQQLDERDPVINYGNFTSLDIDRWIKYNKYTPYYFILKFYRMLRKSRIKFREKLSLFF